MRSSLFICRPRSRGSALAKSIVGAKWPRQAGRLSNPHPPSRVATRPDGGTRRSYASASPVLQPLSGRLPREDNSDRHLVTRSVASEDLHENLPFHGTSATLQMQLRAAIKRGKKEGKRKFLQRRLRRPGKLFINFNFNVLARDEVATRRLFFQTPKSGSEIVF